MEATWRTKVGVRAAVSLTFAVALLSIATGVSNIGFGAAAGVNLFGGRVPDWAQEAAGFTGTLTGFLMLASAVGMRRGLRVAWDATVVLLPLTAVQGLVQSSPYSVPLVVVSLAALPAVLAVGRRRFDREVDLTTPQLAALAALVGVLVYGTTGTYALADQFAGVDTPLDAFYYTLTTASTVGYGDTAPATQTARLFGMSVIVLGTASFAIALASLLGPALEAHLASALGRMTDSQLELLDDHVIVLGYGDLTEPILTELDGQVPFAVVAPEPHASDLGDRGYRVLKADPSDEASLRRAGIERARAVVAATNDDADDALSVLTTRQLNADVRIVAAATDRENVNKLKRAGADAVVSPATIGGHLLVQSALGSDEVDGAADWLTDESSRTD